MGMGMGMGRRLLSILAILLILAACTEGAGGDGKKSKGSAVYRKKMAEKERQEEDKIVRTARHGGGPKSAGASFNLLRQIPTADEPASKKKQPLKQDGKNGGAGNKGGLKPSTAKTPKPPAPPQGQYTVDDFAVKNEQGDWVAKVKQASGVVTDISMMHLASIRTTSESGADDMPGGGKGIFLKDWAKESAINKFREERKAAKKLRMQSGKGSAECEGGDPVGS